MDIVNIYSDACLLYAIRQEDRDCVSHRLKLSLGFMRAADSFRNEAYTHVLQSTTAILPED